MMITDYDEPTQCRHRSASMCQKTGRTSVTHKPLTYITIPSITTGAFAQDQKFGKRERDGEGKGNRNIEMSLAAQLVADDNKDTPQVAPGGDSFNGPTRRVFINKQTNRITS